MLNEQRALVRELQTTVERLQDKCTALIAQRDRLVEALKLALSIIGHPDDAITKGLHIVLKGIEKEKG